MLRKIYNLSLYTAGWGLIPLLVPKSGNDTSFRKGRLGHFDAQVSSSGRPRIWLHAASVGEVSGAVPIIKALQQSLNGSCIVLTVATYQGFLSAQKQLSNRVTVLPFPLDFEPTVTKALNMIRPDIYVALESEFWPNLYRLFRHHRVPTVLLNGRLSDRSAEIYSLFRPLFRPIFAQFEWLAMHSQEDQNNVLRLGARPERTLVLGSSKYEGLLEKIRPQKSEQWRTELQIPAHAPVLVGGSLRRSECIELLEVYRDMREIHRDLIAIFAPRHLERLPHMIQWLESRRMPFQLLSSLSKGIETRHASIILVDRIGVLFELYAVGDLVFCGGTLAPIGGHNILEPAAWKKAIFYGPNLQKVDYEHRILTNLGGSFIVQDKAELLRVWSYWINHLTELQGRGDKAFEALGKMKGVALKQVDLIVSTL